MIEDYSKQNQIYESDSKPIKQCFCIGPDKCSDNSCRIVRDYREKQAIINEKLNKGKDSVCYHDNCSECNGSGIRNDGTSCIHLISCPCSKCNKVWC